MAGGGGSVVLEIDTILCLVCVLYVLFFGVVAFCS